jgi:hypothetical protein
VSPIQAVVDLPGNEPIHTFWWIGYWPAGEETYWWTTAISRNAPVPYVRSLIRAAVSRRTWDALTLPDSASGADSDAADGPEPAVVAAGTVPMTQLKPHLDRLAAGLPGLDDVAAEALARFDARLRDVTVHPGPLAADEDPAGMAAAIVDRIRLEQLRRQRARRVSALLAASLRRAWRGPLVDPEQNGELFQALGGLLLPPVLREFLTSEDREVVRHQGRTTVVIAPGSGLSAVPWELLAIGGGDTRLIEAATVRGGIGPASLVDLAMTPSLDDPTGPALRVIDPTGGGARTARPGRRSVFGGELPHSWHERVRPGSGDVLAGPGWPPAGCTRNELGRLLRERRWSRLLYYGHATSGDPLAPTAAALELAAAPEGERYPMTTADGRHLESAAAVDSLSARVWMHASGLWPAPRRVAFIACQADDSRYVEQLGLTLAAINAGARIVTTTRWVLPTDRSILLADPGTGDHAATTELALAVDDAHGSADPASRLRRWQLSVLNSWRTAADDAARRRFAPLIWSSIVTYVIPDDAVLTTGVRL